MALDDRVAKIFDDVFGLDRQTFHRNLTPADVPSWDSIGHMNLVMLLEKEFNQQFEVDEIMEMSTSGKVVEVLERRGVKE